MKQRATVICRLGTRILLVGREGSRWSLPGGRPMVGEDLQEAAVRELMEETRLDAVSVRYMFGFTGAHTCHHVFAAQIAQGQRPVPSNEITRCCWVKVTDVANFATSVSTKGIVDVLAIAPSSASREASRHKRATAFVSNLRAVFQDAIYCG
ncbi:NUDIX domain-containing protein [Paraburkholderia sp. IMGN_8]|uniref:NUDIX hydrolase n=1 Tax=Paraburkholderia sp. IMGN_8 TaxID=3136564 RepID=UPI0031013B12